MFKKILFGLLCLIDTYTIYSTIGYGIMGNNSPTLYGNTSSIFMGNYILCIVFGVLSLILTTLIILFTVRFFKHKKQ